MRLEGRNLSCHVRGPGSLGVLLGGLENCVLVKTDGFFAFAPPGVRLFHLKIHLIRLPCQFRSSLGDFCLGLDNRGVVPLLYRPVGSHACRPSA